MSRDPITPSWSHAIAVVCVCLLALACAAASAAEPTQPPQQQLDPTKPADAVAIIDLLTQQLELPRNQAIALTVAIETLRRAVAVPPPAPPTTTPPAKD